MEKNNERFQRTYKEIEKNEVRYEARYTEDAEYLVVAFGSIARICMKAIEDARKEGVKASSAPSPSGPSPTTRYARPPKTSKAYSAWR